MNRKKYRETKRGISPLIASVLLIAFTMAVAAILTSWVTGFTKTQTSYVGEKAEKQIKCIYGTMDIKKADVKYNFSTTGSWVNATVFNSGDQDLYNFTFVVSTSASVYVFLPTNQKIETAPLKAREAFYFTATNTSTGAPASSETFQKLKITALCQRNQYTWQELDMT